MGESRVFGGEGCREMEIFLVVITEHKCRLSAALPPVASNLGYPTALEAEEDFGLDQGVDVVEPDIAQRTFATVDLGGDRGAGAEFG